MSTEFHESDATQLCTRLTLSLDWLLRQRAAAAEHGAALLQVLKTKVTAIGDLQYNSKRNKFLKVLKGLKFSLARKLKYDRCSAKHPTQGR